LPLCSHGAPPLLRLQYDLPLLRLQDDAMDACISTHVQELWLLFSIFWRALAHFWLREAKSSCLMVLHGLICGLVQGLCSFSSVFLKALVHFWLNVAKLGIRDQFLLAILVNNDIRA
jgi:hypothetical protein